MNIENVEELIADNIKEIVKNLNESIAYWMIPGSFLAPIHAKSFTIIHFYEFHTERDILVIADSDKVHENIISGFVLADNEKSKWKFYLDKHFGCNTFEKADILDKWKLSKFVKPKHNHYVQNI